MIFWLIAGILTFGAVLALVWPVVNGTENQGDRAEHGLQVYRDQLDELERDRAQGRIGAADLEAARLEIQRRMLAADTEAREMAERAATGMSPSRRMMMVVVLVFFVPASALLTYMIAGNPSLPNQPYADRADERLAAQQAREKQAARANAGQAGQHEGMGEMVARLEQRLKDDPRDLEGWVLLGRSYLVTREYGKAAEALRQAVGLSQGDARTLAAYGEALTMAASGSVTPDALAAFEQALERMPGEPRARFYIGLSASQREDFEAALRTWVSLEADTPTGAGWEALLKSHIDRVTQESGIDVEALRLAERAKRPPPLAQAVPSPAPQTPTASSPGPTQDQVAAAKDMSPEDRRTMIRGMVQRLATRMENNPDDVDGWLRLGRSYGVLQQPDAALKAFASAAERGPDRIDAQLAYARALFPQGTPETAMPPAFKTVIKRLLNLDPALPEALFYGGMIAAKEGDKATARDLWGRLLDRLGPEAPVRPALERRLKALDDN